MVKIGVDVDGVLACFFSAYEELTIEVAGKNLFPALYPEALPPTWNWPEHYGYSDSTMREVWKRIKADPVFWSTLDPLPGVEEFIYNLDTNPDYEVYYITDRPGFCPQYQTQAWLEVLGAVWPSVIISRKGKGVVADALSLDLYIDDKGENVLDVETKSPSTQTYLLSYPYNQGFTVKNRVESLDKFWEVITCWK